MTFAVLSFLEISWKKSHFESGSADVQEQVVCTGGKDSPSEVKQCGEHCLGLRYSGEANGVPLETTMGHFKTGGCVS